MSAGRDYGTGDRARRCAGRPCHMSSRTMIRRIGLPVVPGVIVRGENQAMRGPAEFWLVDMDGVLVREEQAVPGSAEFIERLTERQRRYLVLTNNSIFTPRDL